MKLFGKLSLFSIFVSMAVLQPVWAADGINAKIQLLKHTIDVSGVSVGNTLRLRLTDGKKNDNIQRLLLDRTYRNQHFDDVFVEYILAPNKNGFLSCRWKGPAKAVLDCSNGIDILPKKIGRDFASSVFHFRMKKGAELSNHKDTPSFIRAKRDIATSIVFGDTFRCDPAVKSEICIPANIH